VAEAPREGPRGASDIFRRTSSRRLTNAAADNSNSERRLEMDRGSGSTLAPWMAADLPSYASLEGEHDADVCVVGAGIAGLSTAYELALAGRSVIVLEDGEVASGETSRTTAHLTAAFDDRYDAMERLHGPRGATLLADSHSAAIDRIEQIVRAERIDCRFERLDGYLFMPPGDPQDPLERELDACHRAGLWDVEWAERAPIADFHTGRCLRFPNQAQFHPRLYLAGLLAALRDRHARVFTKSHVTAVERREENGQIEVKTERGTVRCNDAVIATNTPVNDWVTMHTKQYPYRTYVIAAPIPKDAWTPGLYWDTAQPYHYVRGFVDGAGHTLLISGGEDHKTGQEDDGRDRWSALESWTRERFPHLGEVRYRWSGQVLEPMDGVAFIGRNPGDRDGVWIATGDSGNGMTHGAIAGMLLRDLILGGENEWAKVYDPSRRTLRAAGEFAKENLNMVAQYGDWLTPGEVKSEDEIPKNSGAIVRHGLHKHAVYRDARGQLHRCSATCPHLGAILSWNSAECTWDCPAHGSRFDPYGQVINGPANGNLAPADEHAHEHGETRRAG